MNPRIREIAQEAGHGPLIGFDLVNELNERFIEKFSELIINECRENFIKVWYEQGLDIRGADLDKFMQRFREHFGDVK